MVIDVVSSLIGLFMTTPKSTKSIKKALENALDEFQDKLDQGKMKASITVLNEFLGELAIQQNYSMQIEGHDKIERKLMDLDWKTDLSFYTASHEMVMQGIDDEI